MMFFEQILRWWRSDEKNEKRKARKRKKKLK